MFREKENSPYDNVFKRRITITIFLSSSEVGPTEKCAIKRLLNNEILVIIWSTKNLDVLNLFP